jgi:hypothetical protein
MRCILLAAALDNAFHAPHLELLPAQENWIGEHSFLFQFCDIEKFANFPNN